MRSFSSFLALFASQVACTVSTAPPPPAQPSVPGASACANVTCSGHGTCQPQLGPGNTFTPTCTCDSGYILEDETSAHCIPYSPGIEGSGYRFEAEPDAGLVASELAALEGSWYAEGGDWLTRQGQGDVVDNGYVFNLPQSAGPAQWSAQSVATARSGATTLLPPDSNVVQIGAALTGDLAGFRPLQFSKSDAPDQATSTVLYTRSEEPGTATSGGPTRPVLVVFVCDQSTTMGIAKPLIASCAEAAGGTVPGVSPWEKFVPEMFDGP
ncbi:MAG TPA: hypothetical protein VGI39_14255 [Polyangiaceae bacterium]|jgi:hypothetical protein